MTASSRTPGRREKTIQEKVRQQLVYFLVVVVVVVVVSMYIPYIKGVQRFLKVLLGDC